jgi:uncharacterized membrane protein YeaQ/YmgE (transglycosylase-associated protein family)
MLMTVIWWLLVGLIAGYLAGIIMKGKGFGLLGNLFVGILGAVIGGYLFSLLGRDAQEFVGNLAVALAGAVILVWVVGVIKKK